MKKVLISLKDWEAIAGEIVMGLPVFSPEICCMVDNVFKRWFEAQPDAPIYRSGSFKITPEQLDKFMQSDNLVLDGTKCKTCGQLGRIKKGVLSKMETTGDEDDN